MHRYDLLKMARLDCKVRGGEVPENGINERVAVV